MKRSEIKAIAREQLGGNIFAQTWLVGLLACFIVGAAQSVAGTVLPGIGAIIIMGPFSYGLCLAFLNRARGSESMELEDVFKGFTKDFTNTLLIGLMTQIFTFLWSLLFIIPGIVKAFAYSMAYYIKIDHPDYDWNACIKESMRIMRGHKWELFVLELSFIGWFIVGSAE